MLERVCEELRDIGLTPRIVDLPNFTASPRAVVFDVNVLHGRYGGQTLALALSFQDDLYPEYPPHFVHFKSSVDVTLARRYSEHVFEEESWSAYSLPPSDFWDNLTQSEKTMKTYYRQ